MNNNFICLVKSKQIKQEVSLTMILPLQLVFSKYTFLVCLDEREKVLVSQCQKCDQMPRLFFTILPWTYNENLPNIAKFGQTELKTFSTTKKDVGKITKTFIKCKSGKISPNLVTLSMTAPCVCALKELNEFLELLELDSFCAMNRVEKK